MVIFLDCLFSNICNFQKCSSFLVFFREKVFEICFCVDESIVNAPLLSLQSKNIKDAKSEVRFKQLMRDV
jgi:hypothetical protein